jgi:hypothetical protein
MGLGQLEPTFETLVESFVFLDKNKDGYVSKSEMIQAINETTAGERSSGRIGMKRFGESSSPVPSSAHNHPSSNFQTWNKMIE